MTCVVVVLLACWLAFRAGEMNQRINDMVGGYDNT